MELHTKESSFQSSRVTSVKPLLFRPPCFAINISGDGEIVFAPRNHPKQSPYNVSFPAMSVLTLKTYLKESKKTRTLCSKQRHPQVNQIGKNQRAIPMTQDSNRIRCPNCAVQPDHPLKPKKLEQTPKIITINRVREVQRAQGSIKWPWRVKPRRHKLGKVEPSGMASDEDVLWERRWEDQRVTAWPS